MKLHAVWIGILALCIASAGALNYYVSPTGNDAGAGTSAQPFRTIQKAANVVNPGDSVIVRDGVYTLNPSIPSYVESGLVNYLVILERSGTPSAWITFKSENKWGAKMDGQSNRGFIAFLFGTTLDHGSYVRVDGFEVYGFAAGLSLYNRSPGAHDVVISNNNIHDLGRFCTTTPYGLGVAIGGAQFSNVTIENNIIHDNGRLRPGEGGCTADRTAHYQNNDHGIYMSSYDNLIIKNNIFYNHREGWAIQLGPTGGSRALIANNTFAFKNPDRDGHIVVEQRETNTRIVNNIFYQPGAYAISFYDASATGMQVTNNVTDAPGMILAVYSSGGTPTANPAGVVQLNNRLSTNPMLVNPAALNFQLAVGSPAINGGISLTTDGVTKDYAETARPQGPAFDIGAYEYLTTGIEWGRASLRMGSLAIVRPTSLGAISIISAGTAKASASIYSLKGEKLASMENIGAKGATWNPGRNSAGVYLVRVQAGNDVQAEKIYCGK